jgi:nucleoid DNA-binding protein
MNKAALETNVAEKLGVSKVEAAKVVKTVLDSMISGAMTDGECVFPGVGKLKVITTKAKEGETLGKKWSKPAGKAFRLNVTKEGKTTLA